MKRGSQTLAAPNSFCLATGKTAALNSTHSMQCGKFQLVANGVTHRGLK